MTILLPTDIQPLELTRFLSAGMSVNEYAANPGTEVLDADPRSPDVHHMIGHPHIH